MMLRFFLAFCTERSCESVLPRDGASEADRHDAARPRWEVRS